MKRLLLVGVAFLAMLPMTAAARARVGVFIGPRFGFAPYGFAPYGWYGWYGPYYGMYPYGYFGPPAAGEVKLDTNIKDAQVFIDGHYAGTVGQLKTITMRPGSYDIEIRAPGRAPFRQDIYVVAGKTLKLHPDLEEGQPRPTGS
jgi:hypothetical protein